MPELSSLRLLLIVAVALLAHAATALVRRGSQRLLRSRLHSEARVRTISGFVVSAVVFAIYFAAVGFALSEPGVSLTTYVASASVIGLAVRFGSRGLVPGLLLLPPSIERGGRTPSGVAQSSRAAM